jgi:hypothetical protein
MDKDEALKVAVKLLSKLILSNNDNPDSIEMLAFIHTAEAEKNYDKIFFMLEETRKFIVKLQTELKKK